MGKNQGFTLLEVVAALALLAVSLGVILTSLGEATASSRQAIENSQALVVAESQLQLYLAEENKSLHGEVKAEEGPDFLWDIREMPESDDLVKVTITVAWKGFMAPGQVSLSRLREVK